MLIEFNKHFSKDLDKIQKSSIKLNVLETIGHIELAATISEIRNLKKLKDNQMPIELELAIIE